MSNNTNLRAAESNAIIGDIIASRPAKASIVADARHSHVISDRDAENAPQYKADIETLTQERSASHSLIDDRYPPPTEEERVTLRKVSERLPWIAYTLCLVEFAERASYYGASQIFNNFLEFPLPEGKSNLKVWLSKFGPC